MMANQHADTHIHTHAHRHRHDVAKHSQFCTCYRQNLSISSLFFGQHKFSSTSKEEWKIGTLQISSNIHTHTHTPVQITHVQWHWEHSDGLIYILRYIGK